MDRFLERPKGAPSVDKNEKGASAVEKQTEPQIQPWVEKHRPRTMEDVCAQDNAVRVLERSISNLPHMLFYGPPGTGKTSTILALCRTLYGPSFRSRVLELNASDERGISVIREKVKSFARSAVAPAAPGFPSPNFKIIILDEADSMTNDAQSALRRILETHSRTTRFCLICNYISRIIEPLTSRCAKFRFRPLDSSSAISRLRYICDAENVSCSDDLLQEVVRVSQGDLRRAVTYLQSASRLPPITTESINEIAGRVPPAVSENLGKALGLSDPASTDVDNIILAVDNIVRLGYSAFQVLTQLHDLIILSPTLPSRAKATIAIQLAEADKRLTDGADEHLQLLDTACKIHGALARA